MPEIMFTIDGTSCPAKPGQTILEASKAAGIYIPSLCAYDGLKPAGACRICTVRAGGRYMAACTQPASAGLAVENMVPDLEDMRRALIEMLFVEGNHMCPTCEKSGNCELQALAYRYEILAPRFPYQFPKREVQPGGPWLLLEHNRCIQCQRCVQAIQAEDGRKVFALLNRSRSLKIGIDPELAGRMSEETARRAMEVCPVGTILKKEVGFAVPIGKRKFDGRPIGAEIQERAGR